MKKKPEVGQWWVNVVGDPPRVHETGIVLFVGRDSKKRLLWEDCQEHIETDYNLDWSNWHHEPACTGWDWVPEVKDEQKWPQWIIPTTTELSEREKKPIAFYRRDGLHSGETFHTDGSSFKWGTWEHLTDARVCSEREAMDRILPKLLSPDVVNDLAVSVRKEHNCNTFAAKVSDVVVTESKTPLPCSYCYKPEFKGWVLGKCPYCVKIKAASVTVTVYEVVFGDDLDDMNHRMAVGDSALNSVRKNWKYVSVVSTKTVEVML